MPDLSPISGIKVAKLHGRNIWLCIDGHMLRDDDRVSSFHGQEMICSTSNQRNAFIVTQYSERLNVFELELLLATVSVSIHK